MANALETFTSVDGTDITSRNSDSGHSWTANTANNARVLSNAITSYLNTQDSYRSSWAPATAEYDVECAITSPTGGGGPLGRYNSGTVSGYFAFYNSSAARWEMYEYVSGVPTSLGTYSGDAPTTTKYLRLSIRDAYKRLYIDGVQRITSANNNVTAAGAAGFLTGATSATDTVDNWKGNELIFVGSAVNVADNSFQDASAARSVTPPAGMVTGDLVYVTVSERNTGHALSVSNTGGQTWTAETAVASGSQTVRAFWCQYNGTWSANPSFVTDTTGSWAFSVVMQVFRADASLNWATDVAQSNGNATGGNVTVSGHSPAGNPSVSIATWFNTDFGGSTFALQTAGWLNPGEITQFRNQASGSTDQTVALAYRVNTETGFTGDVTNQSADSMQTFWLVHTFKQVAAGGSSATTFPGVGGVSATAGGGPAKTLERSVAPAVAAAVMVALTVNIANDRAAPGAGLVAAAALAPTIVATLPPSAALAPATLPLTGAQPTLLRYRTIFPALPTASGDTADNVPTLVWGWLPQPGAGLAVASGLIPSLIQNGSAIGLPSAALATFGALIPTLVASNANTATPTPLRGEAQTLGLAPSLGGLQIANMAAGTGFVRVQGLAPALAGRVSWLDVGSPQAPVWRDVG